MGWFEDKILDPLTGKDKEKDAIAAAEQSEAAQRKAAGRARDVALTANEKALDSQLKSATGRSDLVGRYYDDAQSQLSLGFDRLSPIYSSSSQALSKLAELSGLSPTQVGAMPQGAQDYDPNAHRRSRLQQDIADMESKDRWLRKSTNTIGRMTNPDIVARYEGLKEQLAGIPEFDPRVVATQPQAAQPTAEGVHDDFYKSPGYQFRVDEGDKAIRRLASARGHLGSGSMYKDLMKHNQNLASDEYGNYIGQLQQLSTMFPTTQLADLSKSSAGNRSQLGMHLANIEGDVGDARSSAYLSEGAIKGGYETLSGDILSQLALAKGAASNLSGISPTLGNISNIANTIDTLNDL